MLTILHPNHIGPTIDATDRGSLIRWLCWNDPNGTYTDCACAAEGIELLTLEEALEIYGRQTEEL